MTSELVNSLFVVLKLFSVELKAVPKMLVLYLSRGGLSIGTVTVEMVL